MLKFCAKSYIHKVSPYVIGITGSVGKTSSRMIISHVLQESLVDTHVSTSPKNFNSEIGLCLAILGITSFTPSIFGSLKAVFLGIKRIVSKEPVDVLVLEYGIDAPGDMSELLDICVPHCAIFTGLDIVHASQFESPDEILQEKSKLLLEAKEIVFYPSHASYLNEILELIEVDILSFGLSQTADDDVGFDQYSIKQDSGGRIVSQFHIDQGIDDVLTIQSNLIGEISAGYTSLGIQIIMILGQRLSKEIVFPSSLNFVLQAGRFSIFQGIGESVLIDSSYNAAPQSMKATIEQIIGLRNEIFSEYELIYCLGDMNELGDFSVSAHQQLASKISQSAHMIYLIGSQTIYTQDELVKIGFSPSRVHHFSDSRHLGIALKQELQVTTQKYLVLFKASQGGLYIEEALKQVMLHESDYSGLPRQEKRWKQKKDEFFKV